MSEAEFGVVRSVAAYISKNFDELDFATLKNVGREQLSALTALLSGAVPSEPGKIVLRVDEANFETLRDIMDFADGFLNEEFENDRDTIIQIADALQPR